MKKNKAITIFLLLLIISIIFAVCINLYMNKSINIDKALAAVVAPNVPESSSSRFVGSLDSTAYYSNVSSCDMSVPSDYFGKYNVSSEDGRKTTSGCVYYKSMSRTPKIGCSSGYLPTKISGKDRQNNNKEYTIYVCKKINSKIRYLTTFSSVDYADVSECGDGGIKDYVGDENESYIIYGCAYKSSGTYNIKCSADGYTTKMYIGKDLKNNNEQMKIYLCQKDSSNQESNNTGGNPSSGTTSGSSSGQTSTPTTPSEEDNTVQSGGKDTGTIPVEENSPRLEYDSICRTEGFMTASKIVGIIILVAKWLAPLILIIMGMIDFFKAVISSSDKALSDATGTFIKRMIIAIIIPIIPGLLHYLIGFLVGIYSEETEEKFELCTNCVNNPLDKKACDIELYDYDNQRGEKDKETANSQKK